MLQVASEVGYDLKRRSTGHSSATLVSLLDNSERRYASISGACPITKDQYPIPLMVNATAAIDTLRRPPTAALGGNVLQNYFHDQNEQY